VAPAAGALDDAREEPLVAVVPLAAVEILVASWRTSFAFSKSTFDPTGLCWRLKKTSRLAEQARALAAEAKDA
jgi:hypothetical protein